MKNTFGNHISLTLFGESHGSSIGAVLDGLPAGVPVDEEFIRFQLSLRRPAGAISTARREQDPFVIESGVFEGKTTGSPLCIRILNADTRSGDYSHALARPGHADMTAFIKYKGCEDYRGGGHFSGRITAALVAAGGILLPMLRKKGIFVGTHVARIADVSDRPFNDILKDIETVNQRPFAVLDEQKQTQMEQAILAAKAEGDSVGGILETAVVGLPVGIGEPWFDSLEGMLAHALFSIPAVKGVEFGDGFAVANRRGSEVNDAIRMENAKPMTLTNHNGGINGGISNGMPLLFRLAVKPTPTISKPQQTVDLLKGENAELASRGRHDPCIVHRARVVADSVTALVLCDMLSDFYGRNGWDA